MGLSAPTLPFVFILIFMPFMWASIPLWLKKRQRKLQPQGFSPQGSLHPLSSQRKSLLLMSLISPVVSFILSLTFLYQVLHTGTQVFTTAWIPTLGLNLTFRLDALSLLFSTLISGIGILVLVYARYYLSDQDNLHKLYSLLLLFMTAMLGIVLSENILILLVFWEFTSLVSFLLIGYWPDSHLARQGARTSLLVTAGGGLFLLIGFVLLGQIAGSYELTQIFAQRETILASPLYPLALAGILLGAFTKSAQVPFYFWLPHAMAAPTPVSAYLHSATMVKAGVFLLARLFPAVGGTDLWIIVVSSIGLFTMLYGAIMASFKYDLKSLLAFSTVSHLGLITMLLGFSTPLALFAALFHLINHAVFKAPLFMITGAIEHATGTRDLRRLSGLSKTYPFLALLTGITAAAMAGMPLFNGFLSKEMMLEASLAVAWPLSIQQLYPWLIALAAICSVFYSARIALLPFYQSLNQSSSEPTSAEQKLSLHPISLGMLLPIAIFALGCILVGIAGEFFVGSFLHSATESLMQAPLQRDAIRLWHGWTLPLGISLLAFALAALFFRFRHFLQVWYAKQREFHELTLFNQAIERTIYQCQRLVQHIENGQLSQYLVYFFYALAILITGQLFLSGYKLPEHTGLPLDLVSITVAVALILSTLASVWFFQRRFVSLLLFSITGLMLTILFARHSAPDLALTQLSVEAVSVILLMLALYFMPQASQPEQQKNMWVQKTWIRDAVIALWVAALVGFLAYAMLHHPYQTISDYYLEHAKTLGGGNNVVNVILVDFRGFDTFGEITVLGIAGLGIAHLLRGLRFDLPTTDLKGRPWSSDHYPILVAMLARITLPLALMISIYILLRGHNAPGGGFVAGLITSVAIVLQYVASGVAYVQERLQLQYPKWIAAGILIAGLTGIGSWFVGYPFLTSAFGSWELPWLGEVELSSALPFDLGVFFAVVGSTLLILAYVGQISTLQPATKARATVKTTTRES